MGCVITPQEIADTVVTHLIRQGRQALRENGRCAYRTETGLSCAVGCLLSDEEVAAIADRGQTSTTLKCLDAGLIPERLSGKAQSDLLAGLQTIHDRADHWDDLGLTYPAGQAIWALYDQFKLDRTALRDQLQDYFQGSARADADAKPALRFEIGAGLERGSGQVRP